jgi:hypothetical protein
MEENKVFDQKILNDRIEELKKEGRFSKLLLTDTVLDKLGFSEYNDLNGDCGSRHLRFKNEEYITIWEHLEKDDDSDGYSKDGIYLSHHYFIMEQPGDMDFINELYELIKAKSPASVPEFEEKCKTLKMYYYLDQYKQTL